MFPPPNGIQTGFNGDYSGLTINKGAEAHPIWSDTRNVDPYVPANGVINDEDVFTDPHTFNILRDPNPHVGFGGTGAHYCIGANLAKMTINLIFNAVADNMPDLKPLSKPERLRSGWLNGIKHWQVDYTGKSAVAH